MERILITIDIQYFAALREQRGLSREQIETAAATPGDLYLDLSDVHGFQLPANMVKASVNGAFVSLDYPLQDKDRVVFIPPVAGG